MSDLDYRVGLDGRAFDRGADHVSRRSRKLRGDLRGDFQAAGNALVGFAQKAALVGRAAGVAGAATAAFAFAAKRAADSVNQLSREAQTAGVSFEAFQELRFVSEQNLVGVDALTDGLKEMQLRTDEFIQTGAGPAKESFDRLGLGASELAELLKEPDRLFEVIIDRMKDLDRAAQIRVADELFGGTAGEQFVRFMDQAKGSISESRDRARELGIVMSDDVRDTAMEINRLWELVASTISGRVKSAVLDLSGQMLVAANYLREIEGRSTYALESMASDLTSKIRELEEKERRFLGGLEYLPSGIAEKTLEGTLQATLLAETRQNLKKFREEADAIRRELDRRSFKPSSTSDSSSSPVLVPGLPIPGEKPNIESLPPPAEDRARGKSISDIERQQNAIDDLLRQLDFEREQLRRTSEEQEVYNRLKSVGVDIDSEAGQAISLRVRALESERAAIEAAKQAEKDRTDVYEYGFESLAAGLDAIFDKSQDAEGALRKLAIQLALTAAQGALLGTGPLAGLFNGAFGSGGGFTDGGISAMLGYQYHTGGIAGSGGAARAVDPAIFASAPRYHSGGIAGLAPGEVPAILKRGEPIDPGDGSVFGRMFGGGQVSVILKLSDDLDARIEDRAGRVADVRIERYDEGAVERTAQNVIEAQTRSIL